VAGAPGSGKTTLLATIAGALALEMPPPELSLVLLCAGSPGILDDYLGLPHVRAAASHVRPGEALRVLDSLDTSAALTVIIADDVDAFGPDGRAVTARLEAIAAQGATGHVHVVMATRRPTAVLTPTLRAATGTSIALRMVSGSDSVEVIGIEAAASIPLDADGMAFVRSAGRVERVRVALPFADTLPRVFRCDAPVREATTLAAAARARSSPTPGDRQRRPYQARPAF
jgi:S-DNA-T family DNA segregation ATPase FtsK/SpoIIIE